MLTRIMTLLALALAAGLIAAGCGDDDDETTTTSSTTTAATGATGATGAATGEPLTNAEFVEQADQICADGDAEIEQQQNASPEDVAANIQQQVDDIRALTPPEGDEDEISAILDAADEGVQQLEDTGKFEKAPALQEATQLAKQYGLEVCGSG